MGKTIKVRIDDQGYYHPCPYKVGRTYILNGTRIKITKITAVKIDDVDYYVLEGE